MDSPASAPEAPPSAAALHDDLQFVRAAVERHDRQQYRFIAISVLWALIIAVGYPLIDLNRHGLVSNGHVSLFWGIVPWIGLVISALLGNRIRAGAFDRAQGARHGWHWGVFAIVFGMLILIANQHPEIMGELFGQICMLVTGIVYFLGGLHLDRRYLVPGLFLMVGAGAIGVMGPWQWTIVGWLVAASLVGSALWMRPKSEPVPAPAHAVSDANPLDVNHG